MALRKKVWLAVLVLIATPTAVAWEHMPRLDIYQLAYPVDWEGKNGADRCEATAPDRPGCLLFGSALKKLI